eukprot:TRINITY_DN15856_c0_g2_i1.p1 TRINITY_DN15856_c0_g2~~TRINITY_DN15856_c0_g2_i1.p1  ORF type:complete len:514 (+),score=140.18 TRINITY_DN15856_c0_g2_i1:106-1647(+)
MSPLPFRMAAAAETAAASGPAPAEEAGASSGGDSWGARRLRGVQRALHVKVGKALPTLPQWLDPQRGTPRSVPSTPGLPPGEIDPVALCEHVRVSGRAQGLPPKSHHEQARHAREIAAIQEGMRRRAAAEQRTARRQLELERRRARDVEKTISQWESVLSKWDEERGSRRARRLFKDGVPSKVRARVWEKAVGNALRITPDLYGICLSRGRAAREEALAAKAAAGAAARPPVSPVATPARGASPESAPRTPSNQGASPPHSAGSPGGACDGTPDVRTREREAALSIDVDLPRTFPSFQFFKEGPMHDALTAVLQAYAQYRPDLGYVQGMSYIAAMLLLFLDPDRAFMAMANLVHGSHLLCFFQVTPRAIGVHLRIFDLVLKETLPDLHAHFEGIEFRPQLFVYDWFMTLFAKSLPLDIACRMWDLFLMCDSWLYKGAAGLLRYFEQELLQGGFAECFALLTHLPKDIDEERCMHCVLSVKIDARRFAALRRRAEELDNSCFIQTGDDGGGEQW